MESLRIAVFLWSLMMVTSLGGQVKKTRALDIKMPGARPAYVSTCTCILNSVTSKSHKQGIQMIVMNRFSFDF